MRCPTCGQPAEWKDNPSRPFCSDRCRLIDFGRWANEEYRVPVEERPLDESEAAPPASPQAEQSENQS